MLEILPAPHHFFKPTFEDLSEFDERFGG